MKKLLLPFLLLSVLFISKPAYSTVDSLTIAQAIEDLDMDFVPDQRFWVIQLWYQELLFHQTFKQCKQFILFMGWNCRNRYF